ncbi:protein disabled [Vespula squamosa]|uniref:Protein disabled n=1 Tax=Vespula squamosa TaxID=30214 RepID=A0ABD1ZSZ4_VESSQ
MGMRVVMPRQGCRSDERKNIFLSKRAANHPARLKNEPTRFLGEGVSFKAKLIGILEVSEARGDRMCQAALADLKMAIRAAGEHKQRIAVQVSIDGLRLRDEKTSECLYHHPVHKISFIAQDMSDSRAFGYIFGSPDTGHRFFGIKTDKAASQVVIAMRDLFQVVFELKKKEIELAKQHIEQNTINAIKFHTGGMFVEPAPDTKGAAGTESSVHRTRIINSETEKTTERKNENQSGVIADLLDLQFELNSLQQGIHQMDKITPEQPGPAADDLFESDPFGDSFANMKLKDTVQPILPPPPSSSKRGHLERQQTVPAPTASATSSPAATLYSKTPPPQDTMHWFDKETENLFNDGELTGLAKSTAARKDQDETSLNATPRSSQAKSPQIDVFTELDPLGTGLIKPYVDKKDFFQHLKNPPKKVLKDLVTTNSTDTFPTNFNLTSDTPSDSIKLQNDLPLKESDRHEEGNFANFDRFDENEAMQSSILPKSDSPQKKDIVSRPTHHQPLSVSLPPEETPTKSTLAGISSANIPATAGGTTSVGSRVDKDTTESIQALVKLPSPKKYLQSVRKREFDIDLPSGKSQSVEKPFPVDFSATSDSPASPLRSCSSDANSRLSSSSAELDLVPEPPPRGAGGITINPPPLPPKKQAARGAIKPPPRPPYTEGHFHYDFIEREETSPSPTRSRERAKSPSRDARGGRFDDNFSPPSQASARTDLISTMTASAFEDSFSSMIPTTNLSTFFTSTGTPATTRKPKPSLDITLSQLTSANLDELAGSLGMTVQELTSLTLQQLTECLANLSCKESATEPKEEETVQPKLEGFVVTKPSSSCKITETSFVSSEPLFKANFDQEPMRREEVSTYDKYAVFRELLEMEQMQEESREETNDEEVTTDTESKEPEERKGSEDETRGELTAEAIVAMANLTVKLPPSTEELTKKEEPREEEIDETNGIEIDEPIDATEDVEETRDEPIEASVDSQASRKMELEIELEAEGDIEADIEEDATEDATTALGNQDRGETSSDKGSEANGLSEKVVSEGTEDLGRSSVTEKTEVRSSTSTSSDRYAALREIIGETERLSKQSEEESSSRRESPVVQASVSKNSAEAELLSLFSDSLPGVPPSPKRSLKRKEDDLKTVAMDIFEEIKMLNTGTHKAKEVKAIGIAGFEDVFCPFGEESAKENDREDGKEDGNWAKFETSMLGSDRSSCEGARSVGGTSPWSPDGKDFHRDVQPFKSVPSTSGVHRHSGDSDNEWKDEEESEESNGRGRLEGRFWCGSRHPRFDAAEFDERSFYEEASGSLDNRSDKRDRSFRGRAVRKSRGPWAKNVGHRPRDPSRWHEKPQWEEVPRRYPHRKLPYKENDDHYDVHDHLSRFWKCRPKSQRWNWIPDDAYYDEERRRKMTERKLTLLWNEEDRFDSEESVGFEDDDRWAKRKYERRRWDDEYGRYWNRRSSPPLEGEYPPKEGYYYYRESRERPHDYTGTWEEEYGPERAGDESGRYNTAGRKRHWPKRPNSANEGRNTEYGEVVYADARNKFGTSRSECSDNDSDIYLRPSQRSRSRESYWGSDQEYDSWPERPYWSEGPDVKSETLHRKRVARPKAARQAIKAKTQSPFEDDFAQNIEQVESPASETLTPAEPRVRSEISESKRELVERPPPSPTTCARLTNKDSHLHREMQRECNKRAAFFDDDLISTVSVSTNDVSERRRLSSDMKVTSEAIPADANDPHRSIDGFVSEDSGRDSFFNGDLRFDDDDAFAFKSELEDSVPEHCAATLPLKNARQNKYAASNSNNKGRPSDQYIRKSESAR